MKKGKNSEDEKLCDCEACAHRRWHLAEFVESQQPPMLIALPAQNAPSSYALQ